MGLVVFAAWCVYAGGCIAYLRHRARKGGHL